MKSASLLRTVLGLSALLPIGIAAGEAPARACGTEVFSVVDENAARISTAERALSQGRYAQAGVGVLQVFPKIAATKPGAGPLTDRGLRILALAVARTDGAITLGKTMAGTTPEGREKNLLFSIDTLRKLNEKRANNPSIQTDLAEALSKVPRFKAEAYEILGKLAAKDLIASPEGYATLARLRDALGDDAGRDTAVKRCEGMTKSPKMCAVPVNPTTSS